MAHFQIQFDFLLIYFLFLLYLFSMSFSYRAIVLTAIYFVGIYLLAQFKNRRRIRSMKIYDLIYFERKNENAMIQKNGLQKKIFVISIVLGMIGTLCLMMRDLLLGIIGALCIIIFLYGFFASFSSGVPVWFEKHAAQKYQKQNLLVSKAFHNGSCDGYDCLVVYSDIGIGRNRNGFSGYFCESGRTSDLL